jgi:hypothetical protein
MLCDCLIHRFNDYWDQWWCALCYVQIDFHRYDSCTRPHQWEVTFCSDCHQIWEAYRWSIDHLHWQESSFQATRTRAVDRCARFSRIFVTVVGSLIASLNLLSLHASYCSATTTVQGYTRIGKIECVCSSSVMFWFDRLRTKMFQRSIVTAMVKNERNEDQASNDTLLRQCSSVVWWHRFSFVDEHSTSRTRGRRLAKL